MTHKYDRLQLGGRTYILVPEEEFQGLLAADSKASRRSEIRPLKDRIKDTLDTFGLSENDLATLAGTTQAQVSRLMFGQKPTRKTIDKFNKAFQRLHTKRK